MNTTRTVSEVLPAEGLAHALIRCAPGRLLRAPRALPPDIDPGTQLIAQAISFRRAAPSGHVPILYDLRPPDPAFPYGALEIAEIEGRLPRLDSPHDFRAIGQALGRIHALPLPPRLERPPLPDRSADPLGAVIGLIRQQTVNIHSWPINDAVRQLLAQSLKALKQIDPPTRYVVGGLCLTDCHPGNFLIIPDGRAIFVDLERAQYGCPAFDLAHASTWPAIAWDPRLQGHFTPGIGQALLEGWRAEVSAEMAASVLRWLPLARQLIVLRSASWLGRFLAEGLERLPAAGPGWAADRRGVAERITRLLHADPLAAALAAET